jgi:hypothetical protein
VVSNIVLRFARGLASKSALVLALALGLTGACGGSDGASGSSQQSAPAGGEDARHKEVAANQARIGENEPPRAHLKIVPGEGWAGLTMLHFDAGLSTDDFTKPAQLLKRFDYDGDGTWDTGLQRGSRVGWVLDLPGEYRPRVLVKDTGGLVDSVTADPIVIHPACPPPDFALLDVNPNSPTKGQTLRLSEQRGHPVLAWVVTLSK